MKNEGALPAQWSIQRMEQLCSSVRDGTHDTPKPVNEGKPLITSKHIKRGSVDLTDAYLISPADHEAINKRSEVHQWDVLVSMIGTVGEIALVKEPPEYAIKNVGLLKAGGPTLANWLYHYLKSPSGQATITTYLSGTSQAFISLGSLRKLPVIYPPPAEQQKIAAILTAYDDLIENNRQRIALLEKMAEEIYREWFVRLRFPRHEHTPAHKGVPEGWRQQSGDQLFVTAKGRSYSSSDISDFSTGEDAERPFLTLKSLNRGGGYRRKGLKYYRGRYSDGQIVTPGDVIMAVTDMTQNRAIVGQAARVPALPECENAAISLDLVCLRPKSWSKNFLYAFCRYSGFASHLAQFANGANVLHLKPSLIGAQKLLSPTLELIGQFDEKTSPIFELVDTLTEQVGELSKNRDVLLNRLISGKLRVDDLDIQFPPSMQDAA